MWTAGSMLIDLASPFTVFDRLINLRNGLRPTAKGPGDLLVSEDSIYQKASMLATRECALHRTCFFCSISVTH